MKATQVIITKKPGHLIPAEYLELALRANPSCAGYALQDVERDEKTNAPIKDGRPILITERLEDRTPKIEEINDLQENFKDHALTFFFGNMPQGFDKNDVQPFVLHSEQDGDMLAVFIDGDFPGYEAREGRTSQANLSDEIITPALSKMFGRAKSYPEFIEDIDGIFEKMLMNTSSGRCVFAFMPVQGDPIAFGNNEQGEVYDWGSVSNHYGFGHSAKQETVAEAPKKKGWWGKKTTATEDKPAEVKPTEKPAETKPVETKPAVTPAPTGPAETAIPAHNLKGHWEKMPDKVVQGGYKTQKTWLRNIYKLKPNNSLPEGWKNQRNFFIPETKLSSFEDLAEAIKEGRIELVEQPKDMKAAAPIVAKAEAPKTGADIKAARTAPPAKDETNLMTMSVEETTSASNQMATFLDYKSNEVPNPLTIQKTEAKYPKFTEKVPVTLNELLLITPDQWNTFQKKDSKAFFLAFLEIKRAYVEASGIKLEDLIPVPSTKEATPAKEETVSPAPAKRGGGFFKKTA